MIDALSGSEPQTHPGTVRRVSTALLYDVHGNLPALEAVLSAAEEAGATSYVLGGDYAAFGPWPRETVELLETVRAVVRIRGNVERWLREEPDVRESEPILGTLVRDFNFKQKPRPPLLLDPQPQTDLSR